jgi:hypothetical protein
MYLRPTDRAVNPAYSAAITSAAKTIRTWYAGQLGGRSFHLKSSTPEQCQLPHASSYYLTGSWDKVLADVQACAPVTWGSSTTTWVLYVDVLDSPCGDPGRLGAALPGLTILPRADLQGLIGQTAVDGCGQVFNNPVERWVGGLGHELGHTFGVPHPPGCDAGQLSCDTGSIMWTGFYSYPATYFSTTEKATLLASPFIS